MRFVRRQPGTVLSIGALAGFAAAAANLVGLGTVYPRLQEQLTAIEPLAADPQAADQNAAALALVEVLVSLASLLALIAVISWPVYMLANGLLIHVLGRDVFGESTTTGEAWAAVRRKIPGLLGQLLVIAVMVLVSTLPIIISLSMAGSQPVTGLGLAMVLAPLCLVALLMVLPRLLLAPVCLVLEDVGVSQSFIRARELARGHAWRVLGVAIGGLVLSRVIAAVIGLPFSLLAGADPLSTLGVFMASLGRIAGTTVSFPILSAIIALLYVDLRVRTERLGA